MAEPKLSKPMTKSGKIVSWFMIAFIVMIGLGGGVSLITEALNARDALAHGPAGALTPNDRDCGRSSCSWIGEFVSADGTVTRSGVLLRDAERIGHGDPMPATIDNVRLYDDDGRPTAYTIDYDAGVRTAAGVSLLVFCLVTAAVLARALRRYGKRHQHHS